MVAMVKDEVVEKKTRKPAIVAALSQQFIDWARENGVDVDTLLLAKERYVAAKGASHHASYEQVGTERLRELLKLYEGRMTRIRQELLARSGI